MTASSSTAPTPISKARQSRAELLEELRAAKQRCLDQEAVIDTFRRLLAAIVLKHGTVQTLHIDRNDIAAAGSGQVRVQEMPTGIVIAVKMEGQSPLIRPRPKLVR